MSYSGYRVKIGNTIINNNMIAPGTFSYKKEKRLIRTWTDANGVEHFDYFSTPKVSISFSVRERNLIDHESICSIFVIQENLAVTYWDDYTCTYLTGTFHMKEPSITHKKGYGADIQYNATQISLEEY